MAKANRFAPAPPAPIPRYEEASSPPVGVPTDSVGTPTLDASASKNEITIAYNPRKAFLPFHMRSQRFAVLICHRRAGKTVACINELVTRAIYSTWHRPNYGYIGPLLKQAKKVAWAYLKDATVGLVDQVSESDLFVKLKHNQAVITIYGADNPDSFRGQYFNGVVVDEYADMAPYIWGSILIPALTDRRGWAIFIGTFKGKNHLYKMSERAKKEPGWFHMILKASQSGLLSQEDLREARNEMEEDEYEQEFECNPLAAIKGSYYAHTINALDKQGRLNCVGLHDPQQKVFVAMDLGRRDSTAIWFWQERPDGLAIIDYEEFHQKDLDFYFDLLKKKGYDYDTIWVPHDARAKTLATKRSTIEQLLDADFPARVAPKLSVQDGIDAARKVMKSCWFDIRVESGLEALRSYKREWDDKKRAFSDNPAHDWASHGADAFRVLAFAAKPGRDTLEDEEELPPPPPKMVKHVTLDEMFKEHERNLRRQRV